MPLRQCRGITASALVLGSALELGGPIATRPKVRFALYRELALMPDTPRLSWATVTRPTCDSVVGPVTS